MSFARLHDAGWYREEAERAQRMSETSRNLDVREVLGRYAAECRSIAEEIDQEAGAPLRDEPAPWPVAS